MGITVNSRLPKAAQRPQHSAGNEGHLIIIPSCPALGHQHPANISLPTPTVTPVSPGDCTHAAFFQKYHSSNRSASVFTSSWCGQTALLHVSVSSQVALVFPMEKLTHNITFSLFPQDQTGTFPTPSGEKGHFMLPVSFPDFGAFQLSHAIKKPEVMLMQTNSEGCRATQNAVIYVLWQHRQCCNILP